MFKSDLTRSKVLGSLAMAGGALWAVSGVIHLTGPELHENLVRTTTEHTILALFAGALILTAAGVVELARYATSRTGALIAVVGMVLLAAAGTASNINGDDFSWFAVVAPLTNLMWLAGSVTLAVSLKRAGRVPRWVYIGLPLVQILALPFHPVGGPLVGGAYFIALGSMLAAQAFERRAIAPVPAAA